MKNKSLKEIVLEAEKTNEVVFMTVDGLMSVDIDKFISQPTEGLLYDLNRDRVTCLTWLDDPGMCELWINNFCAMKVITKLKEMLENNNAIRNGT